MSLLNQKKQTQKKTPAAPPEKKSVTLSIADWNIMVGNLMLLKENVGKLNIESPNVVGIIYSNCTVLSAEIQKQIGENI